MTQVPEEAKQVAHEAADSDWLDAAIRAGLVAYGVVHLLVAWVALQLAFGNHHEDASNQGALRRLAGEPFGRVLVWAIAAGMACLVLWRVLEAWVGHRDADDGDRRRRRIASAGKAVIYAVVAASAVKVATGGGSNGDKGSRSLTARLLDLTAGPWIVGAVGVAVIGYGLNHVRRGLTQDYRDRLSAEGRTGEAGKAYLAVGGAGYVAKGVVIALVGVLFEYAAASHDPKHSGGLDEALRTVLQQPFGPYLLTAIAAGIGCYGLFCFARARHLST